LCAVRPRAASSELLRSAPILPAQFTINLRAKSPLVTGLAIVNSAPKTGFLAQSVLYSVGTSHRKRVGVECLVVRSSPLFLRGIVYPALHANHCRIFENRLVIESVNVGFKTLPLSAPPWLLPKSEVPAQSCRPRMIELVVKKTSAATRLVMLSNHGFGRR